MPNSADEYMKKITSFISKGGTVADLNNVPYDTLDQMYIRAIDLYEKNNYMEALKKFRLLCIFDHWNPKYFIGLGSCQKMIQLYGNAIDSFSYAARLDLLNPLPFVYMGDCYNHLNEFDKAQQSYKAAVVFSKEMKIQNKEFLKAENLLTPEFVS